MDRRALFWGGLALSIGITVLLWSFGIPGFFFALFVPFFLFFPKRRNVPVCPSCGIEAARGDRFCARCGAGL